ncbi:MAG: hypothetical protein LBC59_03460 [Chitinispirillales bacterium]|jgi:hypothetical protein|nr:hypothetical protein [Chitinispirillales bacterium]
MAASCRPDIHPLKQLSINMLRKLTRRQSSRPLVRSQVSEGTYLIRGVVKTAGGKKGEDGGGRWCEVGMGYGEISFNIFYKELV